MLLDAKGFYLPTCQKRCSCYARYIESMNYILPCSWPRYLLLCRSIASQSLIYLSDKPWTAEYYHSSVKICDIDITRKLSELRTVSLVSMFKPVSSNVATRSARPDLTRITRRRVSSIYREGNIL